jgi:hypothetical protein
MRDAEGKMYLIYPVLYSIKKPITIEMEAQRKKQDRNKTLADFLSIKNNKRRSTTPVITNKNANKYL